MTNIQTSAVPRPTGLEHVFEFSQAQAVIESVLGRREGDEQERGHAILQLTAAEFSLLPSFLMPNTLSLPLRAPLTVPGWAAMASIIKGGCSLARPYHYERPTLVTFAGDVEKLHRIASERGDRPNALQFAEYGVEEWRDLAGQLENEHVQANTDIGAAIRESGLIRLQTLIWAAKWAIASEEPQVDIAELEQSLGVVGS